ISDESLDYIFDFYVSGLQTILTKWILKGCVEDETEIIRIIDLCLYKQTKL
ncbi:MAG: TetR family transcriptional regulator C-terminal domain-containing protein, partial [Clostridiales bacterium]|nr:TetR family transcriptional regulator C-terminal domain-containing protein [Clostridiales bacterium]